MRRLALRRLPLGRLALLIAGRRRTLLPRNRIHRETRRRVGAGNADTHAEESDRNRRGGDHPNNLRVHHVVVPPVVGSASESTRPPLGPVQESLRRRICR
ncbi:hypothetical protein GCM10027262_04200 [Nocardia tengchongensis]